MTSINRRAPGALGAVLSLLLIHNAAAQTAVECGVTVNGTNNSAVDVAAVGAAIGDPSADGDHTVCLSGTFDFGTARPATNITLTIVPNPSVTSLRIVGLDNANGNRATIRNGTQPLVLPIRTATSPPTALSNLSIENLRFVSPAFSAISILGTNPLGTVVRISGNQISGVRSYAPGVNPPPNAPMFRQGISASAVSPIVGEIIIADNVVNGGTYAATDQTLAVSAGISLVGAIPAFPPAPPTPGVQQSFFARVTVANNRIVDWSGVGILATGITGATVEGNRIDPGPFANLIPACVQPNGMGAASGISFGSVTNSLVKENVINLTPALTNAGVAPACNAGLILTGSPTVGASSNIFYENRIRGTATHAIVVGASGATVETDNLFALNRVPNFVPTQAMLSLGAGATENIFIGFFPSIDGNSAANDILNR